MLTEDLDALRSAPTPSGVRLLPPRDPYTQVHDRDTIVDRTYHRDIWETVGEPGTILVRGNVAGTWHPRKSGRRLTITVRTFGSLPDLAGPAAVDDEGGHDVVEPAAARA